MIERFYDPDQGNIYFDNTCIKDYNLKALRESIGYVQQEPALILGTIRDNLLYGDKDASETDIYQALERANAKFIHDIDQGLDTYTGSATVGNLSGGQK